MPDPELLLNTDPDAISGDAGATAIGGPPVSITGALDDYVNRPSLPANSLGLVMDDQQKFDAGVHPEQLGALPATSVIDATGAGDDPAGGYAKAIGLTRAMATGGNTAAAALGGATIASRALNGGQTIASALTQAASDPSVAGLGTINKIIAPPLYVAESVARGFNDYHNGASLEDTIAGNAIRGTLVTGASLIPVAGPVAAWAADKYLPDGAVMGHSYLQTMSQPGVSQAALEAIQ